MAEPHVITALVAKRAQMTGRIEQLQDQLRHAIIDPSIELEEIKSKPVPPRHHAFRGEVSRIVLTTLRNTKRPLTCEEIAQRVMVDRGLNTTDERLVRLMAKRTGACLRDNRKKGVAQSKMGPDRLLVWVVAR